MFFQFRHRISGSGSFLKIIFLVSPYFADFFCICHSPSVWQSSLMFLCLQRYFTLENYDLFFRMFLPIPTGVRVKSGRISKKVSPTHALQFYFKVSPQIIKLSNNFFETFFKCSLQCLFRKMQWKRLVTVVVQELKTIVPLYLVRGLKNNTVFSECAHVHSRDYVRGY